MQENTKIKFEDMKCSIFASYDMCWFVFGNKQTNSKGCCKVVEVIKTKMTTWFQFSKHAINSERDIYGLLMRLFTTKLQSFCLKKHRFQFVFFRLPLVEKGSQMSYRFFEGVEYFKEMPKKTMEKCG